MKRLTRRIFIYSCLFLFIGIGNLFSQLRWDSLPGKFAGPNAANVMYADSNYMYAAGDFYKVGGIWMKGIARWNGVKWDSMGAGINGLGGAPVNGVKTMIDYHNKLYVGGWFTSLGNINAFGIGVWDGTKWDSMPVQPFKFDSYSYSSGSIFSLSVINNKLYMGGYFDTVAGQPGVIGIACWNDITWSSLNFPNFASEGYVVIDAICAYKGSIYAGGVFFDSTQADTASAILRYDSTGWHAVGGGIKGDANINSMVVYNGELYVAGYFFKSDGNVGNCIQKWNGTTWSDVGGGTDYQIFNLMVYHGKLYAMGQFDEAGGISASYIAVWDTDKWCNLGDTFDNAIGTSCIYKDSLYIGGGFWTIDGDSISYIAEWTGGDYLADCGQPQGVSEVKNESAEVKVYPNPNNGQFILSLSNVNSASSIEIYNVLGEKVYIETLPQSQNENAINLTGQPNGIYLYRVLSENGGLVGEGKVVIQ